jgi:small conductance mechanosensitive channel
MFRNRTRVVVLAGVVCTVVAWGIPGRSQQQPGETLARQETYLLAQAEAKAEAPAPKAITTEAPTIPVDQLKLLVKPLTLPELETEAAAWMELVKAKVQEISNAEIAIKRKNQVVEQQQQAVKALEDAKAALAAAEEAQKTATPGSPEAEAAAKKVEEVKEALGKAQEAVGSAQETTEKINQDESVKQLVEEAKQDVAEGGKTAAEKKEETKQADREGATASSPDADEFDLYCNQYGYASYVGQSGVEVSCTKENAQTEAAAKNTEAAAENIGQAAADIEAGAADSEGKLQEQQQQLDESAKKLEKSSAAEEEVKTQLVVNVTILQGERTSLIDRLNVVLDEIQAKGGDPTAYRTYIKAVSLVEVDVRDTNALGIRMLSWLQSDEGGVRWGMNIGKFVGILVVSIVGSQLLGQVVNGSMNKFGASSLLREFMVMLVKRGGVIIGVLIALTALEISLGPLLAVFGGLSFILGFALQSNLGNLASGLMIMAYKPFDVGDEVKVGGYWAYIDSITLASTKLKGFDGSIINVPNNNVWGGDIVNFTHANIRKHSISISVEFEQDLDQVYKMWMEITASHPKVLETPAPDWFPWSSQYDCQIPVTLAAWTKTDDYWPVYVDLLKMLQKRIGELGIQLADPTQNIQIECVSKSNGKMSNLATASLPDSPMMATSLESPE